MNAKTEKIVQRLAYEGLLTSNAVLPRKRRITVQEALAAAKEEPRILEVLPAVLLYKPSILAGLEKDLKKDRKLARLVENLRLGTNPEMDFFGIPARDYLKAAEHFRRCLSEKKAAQKSMVLNLRVSPEELKKIKRLSEAMGGIGLSETIRTLIHEKAL